MSQQYYIVNDPLSLQSDSPVILSNNLTPINPNRTISNSNVKLLPLISNNTSKHQGNVADSYKTKQANSSIIFVNGVGYQLPTGSVAGGSIIQNNSQSNPSNMCDTSELYGSKSQNNTISVIDNNSEFVQRSPTNLHQFIPIIADNSESSENEISISENKIYLKHFNDDGTIDVKSINHSNIKTEFSYPDEVYIGKEVITKKEVKSESFEDEFALQESVEEQEELIEISQNSNSFDVQVHDPLESEGMEIEGRGCNRDLTIKEEVIEIDDDDCDSNHEEGGNPLHEEEQNILLHDYRKDDQLKDPLDFLSEEEPIIIQADTPNESSAAQVAANNVRRLNELTKSGFPLLELSKSNTSPLDSLTDTDIDFREIEESDLLRVITPTAGQNLHVPKEHGNEIYVQFVRVKDSNPPVYKEIICNTFLQFQYVKVSEDPPLYKKVLYNLLDKNTLLDITEPKPGIDGAKPFRLPTDSSKFVSVRSPGGRYNIKYLKVTGSKPALYKKICSTIPSMGEAKSLVSIGNGAVRALLPSISNVSPANLITINPASLSSASTINPVASLVPISAPTTTGIPISTIPTLVPLSAPTTAGMPLNNQRNVIKQDTPLVSFIPNTSLSNVNVLNSLGTLLTRNNDKNIQLITASSGNTLPGSSQTINNVPMNAFIINNSGQNIQLNIGNNTKTINNAQNDMDKNVQYKIMNSNAAKNNSQINIPTQSNNFNYIKVRDNPPLYNKVVRNSFHPYERRDDQKPCTPALSTSTSGPTKGFGTST